MTLGIVGPGLIGGSMAIDLRRRGFATRILGVEKDSVNAAAAVQIGIVDSIVTLEECAREADIVVVSVPAAAAVRLLPAILDIFSENGRNASEHKQVVIDTCSTKTNVTESVREHPLRGRYVATHPMAGTEYSGPRAAQPDLFDGRACIFSDVEHSDPECVSLTMKLYDTLNMRVLNMDAESHDVHAAYVSHISHITSFALALTVLEKEKDEKHIFDLASGGFSSTVRLAKSSADMWVPILTQNKDNILHVLDTYIEKMNCFRRAIEDSDSEAIRSLINESNRIKRIIR